MAMRLGFVMSFLVLGLMLGLERSEGVTHSVGETTGWRVPTSADFYETWADGKTFRVGDQLSFNWTGNHDVSQQLTEAQFEACTKVQTNVLTTSPAVIPLTATGKFYFMCNIGTHCSSGQKLEINVTASTGTPPTTGTSPPPPPPGNSSGSFGPMVALLAILSIMVFSFMS